MKVDFVEEKSWWVGGFKMYIQLPRYVSIFGRLTINLVANNKNYVSTICLYSKTLAANFRFENRHFYVGVHIQNASQSSTLRIRDVKNILEWIPFRASMVTWCTYFAMFGIRIHCDIYTSSNWKLY